MGSHFLGGEISWMVGILYFIFVFSALGNFTVYSIKFVLFQLKDDGTVGDTFMNNIQDVASRIPYMTAPGNHENA